MALGADSSFSNEIMINRINSDLANGLGNLVSRTVAMVEKYFGGTLPTEREAGEFDDDLIATATALRSAVDSYIDVTQLNNALAEIFKVVSRANKYIDETAPWVLAKDESKRTRLATVLYNIMESIRIATVYLSCYLPKTADNIFNQINTDLRSYDSVGIFGGYKSGTKVNEAVVLFKRIDKK